MKYSLISFIIVMIMFIPLGIFLFTLKYLFPVITNSHVDFFAGWVSGISWIYLSKYLKDKIINERQRP